MRRRLPRHLHRAHRGPVGPQFRARARARRPRQGFLFPKDGVVRLVSRYSTFVAFAERPLCEARSWGVESTVLEMLAPCIIRGSLSRVAFPTRETPSRDTLTQLVARLGGDSLSLFMKRGARLGQANETIQLFNWNFGEILSAFGWLASWASPPGALFMFLMRLTENAYITTRGDAPHTRPFRQYTTVYVPSRDFFCWVRCRLQTHSL